MSYHFRQIIDLEEVPQDFVECEVYLRDRATGFVVGRPVKLDEYAEAQHALQDAYDEARTLMEKATSFDPAPGDIVQVTHETSPAARRYVAIMKGPGFAGGDRYLDWQEIYDSAGHMNSSAMRSAWMEGRVTFLRRT